MNTELGKKVEELLNRLNMTDDEKAYFYMSIMQYVSQELEKMVDEVLTEEDLEKLEDFVSEQEAEEYINSRMMEEMDKSVQELSDEILREVLERAQIEGIKELLGDIPKLM
jgi:hypothetical protein